MTLEIQAIPRMHDSANQRWHRCEVHEAEPGELAQLLLSHHRSNYELWHQEDDARCPDASDATITSVKHAIDRLNQQRNDLVEQIDLFLLGLVGTQNDAAPLHSETPGLMIDRLSILALKIYHMAEEVERGSVGEASRAANRERHRVLIQQRADLLECLAVLWKQILRGERRFKLYRQIKMYNDPELNPVLYTKGTQGAG